MLWLEHLVRDVRHALRTISRMPLLAAVVVLSLGVGIGANLVVSHGSRRSCRSRCRVWRTRAIPISSSRGLKPAPIQGPRGWMQDYRERLRSFESLLASRMVPFNVGEAASNERMHGQLVSDNYFSTLGLKPAAGRFFRPDEVSRSTEARCSSSRTAWPGRDSAGRQPRSGGRCESTADLTIVGVTPEHFQGNVLGLDFAMWVPATSPRHS